MPNIKSAGFDKKTASLFLSFALRELGIRKKPKKIVFTDTLSAITQDADRQSFGSYNPDTMTITIFRGDRHRADILRTFAHELVHHKQRVEKEKLNGKTGSGTENEANAMAGILMRKFSDVDPKILKTVIKEKRKPSKNKPSSREWGTSSLVNIYKKDTPGQLQENGPAKDVTLIAVPKDKNDKTAKSFWKIGSEVYQADENPQFDSMGHPVGKRWESTFVNFAEAWDEAFAEWFEKTPAWSKDLHESDSTWDVIQESIKSLNEAISLTKYDKDTKKTIKNSIATTINQAIDSVTSKDNLKYFTKPEYYHSSEFFAYPIPQDQWDDDDKKDEYENKVREVIIANIMQMFSKYIQQQLEKDLTALGNDILKKEGIDYFNIKLNFKNLTRNGGLAYYSSIVLSSKLLDFKSLISDIRSELYYTLRDNNLNTLTDVRDFFLTKHKERAIGIVNNITEWYMLDQFAEIFIHELVHIFQHAKQPLHGRNRETEYRSYLDTSRHQSKKDSTFIQLLKKDSDDEKKGITIDWDSPEIKKFKKLYYSSPQEIAAFSHNLAQKIIGNMLKYEEYVTDETFKDYIVALPSTLNHLLHYSEIAKKATSKEKMVYNRYLKLAYQEIKRAVDDNNKKLILDYLKDFIDEFIYSMDGNIPSNMVFQIQKKSIPDIATRFRAPVNEIKAFESDINKFVISYIDRHNKQL